MSTGGLPLTAEDRAILGLESDTIAGHTCKVVVLGGGGAGVEELRAHIASRLDRAPALRRRLGGPEDAPVWEDDEGFDLDRHVVATPAAVERAELPGPVAELFATHLDRDRPLWRLDVVELSGGGTALVWRIHHAVADGTTAMRFARALLFDDSDAGSPSGGHRAHAAHAADDARRREHLAAFLRREFSRSHVASPFDGRIGTRRRVAFARAPLGKLHDAAKALVGATVNDAVLSVASGALRRWLEREHGAIEDVRVKVPVSLHHEGDDAGNRDSFFTLPLPVHELDPVVRLREVAAATTARKAGHDAEELEEVHHQLAHVSHRLEAFCEKVEHSPRRFALNVSNVPGPRERVSVLDRAVRELYSLAEIGEHHALRVAVVSCAGELGFGFCVDPAVVSDVEALAAGVEDEAGALVAAAS